MRYYRNHSLDGATLFSKLDSNKLRFNVKNEMTLICAKYDADLINISKVASRKTKWTRFFGLPGICKCVPVDPMPRNNNHVHVRALFADSHSGKISRVGPSSVVKGRRGRQAGDSDVISGQVRAATSASRRPASLRPRQPAHTRLRGTGVARGWPGWPKPPGIPSKKKV